MTGSRALSLAALLATAAAAQHFSQAYLDIRIHPRDSVTVSVEADAQDMMNTVYVFPTYGDTGVEAFRLYEARMEHYLQQKVKLRADGKAVYLRAVAWKKDGKGREDGLDSVSIGTGTHAFTLGGKLPSGTKRVSIRSEIWNERPELDRPPQMEYFLFEGQAVRRRFTAPFERWVHFPVTADSLAKMSRNPPRIPSRDSDHSGHNH